MMLICSLWVCFFVRVTVADADDVVAMAGLGDADDAWQGAPLCGA